MQTTSLASERVQRYNYFADCTTAAKHTNRTEGICIGIFYKLPLTTIKLLSVPNDLHFLPEIHHKRHQ